MAVPVRTKKSNFVYKGPGPDVGDAWVENYPEVVYMTWELTNEERAFLLDGGNLRIGIWNIKPIPPISVEMTGEQIVERSDFKITKAGWQKPWSDGG